MDMIARCALGLSDISCLQDRENNFYRRARDVVQNFSYDKCLVFVLSFFISPMGRMRKYSSIGIPERKIVADLSEVVLQRERERRAGKEEPLHHDVVVSNCYVMFMAGYETTSTALSYATWLLAAHPDCQERLFQEIEDIFGRDEHVDYDRVMKMPYMHAVFRESLRLYPPVTTFTSRRSIRDTILGGRLRVPAGTNITVPVHVIHWDARNWQDPELFLPERFLDEAKGQTNSVTFLPFGLGPRNCVGARFAEMEFKTVLTKVLRHFRIEIDSEQKEMKTSVTSILLAPLEGRVLVKMEPR